MPRINLLPWREAERKRKRKEFGIGVTASLMLAGLIALILSWRMQAAIDHQNERNQYLTSEIAALDKQIAEIVGLEEQKQRLLARMQVIEQLQRSRPEVVHLFDELVKTLPDGVYLTSVKQTERRVQLRGFAQSSTRVSAYMRNIEASEWLALDDSALEFVDSTKGTGDTAAEFVLNATQVGPGAESSDQEGAELAARSGNK